MTHDSGPFGPYCPVALHKAHKLVQGKVQHAVVFQARLYLLSTKAAFQEFVANPRAFVREPEMQPTRVVVAAFDAENAMAVAEAFSSAHPQSEYMGLVDLNSALDEKPHDDEDFDPFHACASKVSGARAVARVTPSALLPAAVVAAAVVRVESCLACFCRRSLSLTPLLLFLPLCNGCSSGSGLRRLIALRRPLVGCKGRAKRRTAWLSWARHRAPLCRRLLCRLLTATTKKVGGLAGEADEGHTQTHADRYSHTQTDTHTLTHSHTHTLTHSHTHTFVLNNTYAVSISHKTATDPRESSVDELITKLRDKGVVTHRLQHDAATAKDDVVQATLQQVFAFRKKMFQVSSC